MHTEYITYSFLAAIRPHVYDSWNITKQKKFEKIMQRPSKKSLLFLYGSGFFLKIRYYYAFIIKQMKKKHIFWMKFHQKIFNF
jgi:hypothetical protein